MGSLYIDADRQQDHWVFSMGGVSFMLAERRIQAVLMTAQGHSQPEIAAALCLCTRTVRRYLQTYDPVHMRSTPAPKKTWRVDGSLLRSPVLDGIPGQPIEELISTGNWTSRSAKALPSPK